MRRSRDDHGTANQAIDFAIDYTLCDDAATFLRSWQQGDLAEWPEFYTWLDSQDGTGKRKGKEARRG